MLDSDYIQSIQDRLTKHYRNNIDGLDDHHVSVYTSQNTNTGYITYNPNWLDNHEDNDGKTTPPRTITIIAQSKDGQRWTRLVNDYFIHGQKFTNGTYLLNFNFRHNNALTNYGVKKLKHYLKNQFAVHISKTGLLISECSLDKECIPAFANLIKAIQYINNDGYNYVSDKNDMLNATKEMRLEQDQIKQADHDFHEAKRKHEGKPVHHKKRNAPGHIVGGYDSIGGTIRDPRMRKLKKQNAKLRRAMNKRESSKNRTKKHHKKITKTKKLRSRKATKKSRESESKRSSKKDSVDLKDKYVATVGRFKISHTKLVNKIKKLGGHVQASVNGKTDYLVCNKPSKSKKYQNAVKRHIPIINEKSIK